MIVKFNKWIVNVKSLSRVQLFVTPWTVAYQAPPSIGFSRQEYWGGLPFPSPEIFPTQGLNPDLLDCRQMLYRLSHEGSPNKWIVYITKYRFWEVLHWWSFVARTLPPKHTRRYISTFLSILNVAPSLQKKKTLHSTSKIFCTFILCQALF